MDAAGHPVKDVKLTAVPMPSIARAKGPWFQSRPVTTTDAEGNFIFSNLDEGTYTIRITTIGKMGEVTATAGSDEMVQLRLQGSIQ